ncbi:sulfotransferase, partial [Terriglobus sp. YAF25]
MPIPNFFIVGAPKAGTDLLYYELDQHPEIYMSPLKEPCFYSSEIRRENFDAQIREQMSQAEEATRQYISGPMQQKRFGGVVSRREDYERLFAGVHQEKAIGEGSVCYLWSSTAPYAIARDNPKARIVIVLMDPAERAFHQYLKSISDGTVGHAFRRHLDLAMACDQQKLGIFHPFLDFGNYTAQLRRYRECFPAAQIHLSLYEETQADRTAWLERIFTFLGVDCSYRPGPIEVPSTPHV